jgi:hypothetical protein
LRSRHSFESHSHLREALFGIAAGVMVLFVGIHNA